MSAHTPPPPHTPTPTSHTRAHTREHAHTHTAPHHTYRTAPHTQHTTPHTQHTNKPAHHTHAPHTTHQSVQCALHPHTRTGTSLCWKNSPAAILQSAERTKSARTSTGSSVYGMAVVAPYPAASPTRIAKHAPTQQQPQLARQPREKGACRSARRRVDAGLRWAAEQPPKTSTRQPSIGQLTLGNDDQVVRRTARAVVSNHLRLHEPLLLQPHNLVQLDTHKPQGGQCQEVPEARPAPGGNTPGSVQSYLLASGRRTVRA
jgi:hypothetical protein